MWTMVRNMVANGGWYALLLPFADQSQPAFLYDLFSFNKIQYIL